MESSENKPKFVKRGKCACEGIGTKRESRLVKPTGITKVASEYVKAPKNRSRKAKIRELSTLARKIRYGK
ncbi:hypothetical protein [Alteribacillus sp. HJP-4]|uniref:hypothetical protein n=1 Tax=Alteribacillus sp. HJP-4 TaxID=2775394 RepID=UPI0035CCFF29